ncbi:MAG: histidine phosphatase family protein [Bacteroidia bacterium]|nr:histidine phosphatase family protein [Bacteroidia bacterium]
MITVHFIRHAESLGNVNNHLVGGRSSHLPLTERGEEQARLLGQRLKEDGIRFDGIYTSDAVRAKETAKIALAYLEVDQLDWVEDPELAELSQGDWEGSLRQEVFSEQVREEIMKSPLDFKPPSGESQRDVRQRMLGWLEKEVQNWKDKEESSSIAAFSHGFAIRSLIGELTRADAFITRQIVTYNTSISTVYWSEGQWFVERVNDHAHLRGTEFIGHY